jgi:hypothetical protein
MMRPSMAGNWHPKSQVGQTYLYHWNRMGRKGQLCRLLVIARRMGSMAVQFEDGHTAITAAKALGPVSARKAELTPALPFTTDGTAEQNTVDSTNPQTQHTQPHI